MRAEIFFAGQFPICILSVEKSGAEEVPWVVIISTAKDATGWDRRTQREMASVGLLPIS